MDKKSLSEQDIRSKFILPSIEAAGWHLNSQIREDVPFTAGKILVRGKAVKRGSQKRADYILYYNNDLPLAVVEAKNNNESVGVGMEQALGYADILDIPFVYTSNGDSFVEHDRIGINGSIEREIAMGHFPTPEELYERYKVAKNITSDIEPVILQDSYQEIGGKSPRYFQRVAINRAIEAIAKGQKRLLLVMATGTGKTYTAFQIIWRLWKSKTKKRILFLVDRDAILSQTQNNDFKHFGDAMTRIEHRKADPSYEIYLALYQSITGTEEDKNIFKQFSPDFFDLIVVDECHRGVARENASWRDILEYYQSATQIGLTATPKEEKDVSTQTYFGEPIYTYSLKQGIEDGFLAPYKVIRVTIDRDVEGYRPEMGTVDKYGNEIPDEIYDKEDFDRNIVIDERTELVAKKITEFMKATDPMQKTIVFCVDTEHAERMRRALVNCNLEFVRENRKYIACITYKSPDAKADLDNFIDPEKTYPVIAVTSKLMTTGIDTQTCKLIVLDSNIGSATEFKQIIGRGTRVKEDYDKLYFTIMDFRGVTQHFADPEFDGIPIVVYEPRETDPISPVEETDSDSSEGVIYVKPDIGLGNGTLYETPSKFYVANGVSVEIINERVQYLNENGDLITESIKDYSKKNILKEYRTLDEFINRWTHAERKEVIMEELKFHGVFLDELEQEVGIGLDPFDVICAVAYDQKPMTRSERVSEVKKCDSYLHTQGKVREVIDALLEKYTDKGITNIDTIDDLRVSPFTQFGTPVEIVDGFFGGREKYLKFLDVLQKELYTLECIPE